MLQELFRLISRQFIYSTCTVIILSYFTMLLYSGINFNLDKTFGNFISNFSYITQDSVNVNIFIMDALRYIPNNVQHTWIERDFLVIFGIPSVDIDDRRRLRNLQRSTCWQFPDVATRANNFTGAMLVLYVLARHPSHHYEYSAALQEEAAQWHDVVTLSLNEGRVTTNKKIGGDGFWGIEAEIGMGRKTYLWFEFALRVFPNVPFIAKGDDDMFLRVPQYIADMRILPRQGTYWGYMYPGFKNVNNTLIKFLYAFGSCYTLSRDVGEQFVSYKPLQRLVHMPYSKEREEEFTDLYMDHEDTMLGLVLFYMGYHPKIFYVIERKCSFHDVHIGPRVEPVRSSSVMVHHLWENEYEELMLRFGNETETRPRRWKSVVKNIIELLCDE